MSSFSNKLFLLWYSVITAESGRTESEFLCIVIIRVTNQLFLLASEEDPAAQWALIRMEEEGTEGGES